MLITPLYEAVGGNHAEAVRLLLERGACIDWKGLCGWTYLHYASLDGMADAAKVLLDCGIEVNAKSESERSPLHVAAYNRQYDMAKLLIDHGADVNSLDMHKDTSLNDAVKRYNNTDMIDLLLAHGAIR